MVLKEILQRILTEQQTLIFKVEEIIQSIEYLKNIFKTIFKDFVFSAQILSVTSGFLKKPKTEDKQKLDPVFDL